MREFQFHRDFTKQCTYAIVNSNLPVEPNTLQKERDFGQKRRGKEKKETDNREWGRAVES